MTFITIGIFFAEYYEVILKYIGWVFTGILVSVGLYFWNFKRDALKTYWAEKNLEMEAKYKK
jgi:hypothetical protein